MTKIVVDTNIVISALMNTNSRIGQILVNRKSYFNFYSPEYIRCEIFMHKEKIKSIGRLSEFIEAYNLIIRNFCRGFEFRKRYFMDCRYKINRWV